MKAAALLLISILLLAGCRSAPAEIPEGLQCASDSDCATGGCSGELCGAKGEVEGVMTACVYQQQYKCLALTSCGCNNGLCQWGRTDRYNECVEENS